MRLIPNRSSVGRRSRLWRSRSDTPYRLRSDPPCRLWSSARHLWPAVLLSCFFAAALMPAARAETVTIAAAADLTYCIEDLNRSYQQSHPGTELKVSAGSSGNFSSQIQNGAPFDVFLSADIQYPKNLASGGFVDPSTLTVYAVGRIVLWTTKSATVNLDRGIEVLRDRSAVKKIAIANPEHAPYGRAAKAILENSGIWAEVQDRIVQGENIAQTAQFVQTGNVDAGFVALSLLLSPNRQPIGRYIEIDPKLYSKLEQAMVLTKAGSNRPVVRDYFQFLQSPAARKIFDQYGFTLPAKNSDRQRSSAIDSDRQCVDVHCRRLSFADY